jgi:hypothetical protein
MKSISACKWILAASALLLLPSVSLHAAGTGTIKDYLVGQVTKMDAASHDYVFNAEAYNQIIQANHGDYNQAAITNGPEVLSLVAKMQTDYKGLHMNGYETVEGIAAGVKELVKYDIYFDSGVPSDQATTDNPSAPIDLKTASGETIDHDQGNLFHYVIEPTLWGADKEMIKPLSPEAQQHVHGIQVLSDRLPRLAAHAR